MLNSVSSSPAARLPRDLCLISTGFAGVFSKHQGKRPLGNSALMNISGALIRASLELSRFQGVHKSPVPISATAPGSCSSCCVVLAVLKDFKLEQSIPGTRFDAFQQPSVMKYNKLRKPSICVSCKSLISTIPG